MSLILVVEPDARHAAQLASIARTHLQAELVLAESGDRAVAALADRVPDIVLTAPLLPHHDEAVISDYLRGLGEAAAHVQTLTIPILSTPEPPHRGVRGRFRRERPGSLLPDGCDPAVFAEQIGQYLHSARRRRTPDVVTPRSASPAPPLAAEPAAPVVAEAVMPPLVVPEPIEPEALVPELVVAEAVREYDVEEEDVDLTSYLETLAEPEPEPPRAPQSLLVLDPSPLERLQQLERLDRLDRLERLERLERSERPERVERSERPERPGSLAPLAPVAPVHVPQVITVPAPNGEGGHHSVNVAVAVSVQVAAPAGPPPSKRRSTKPKPVQDEWGFFDPDQCGFKALLARLDAIAERDDE